MLDPDVVFRLDVGRVGARALAPVHGPEAVARTILERGAPLAPFARPAMVNGAAGAIVAPHGRLLAVAGFSVAGGRIVAIDIIANPEELQSLQQE